MSQAILFIDDEPNAVKALMEAIIEVELKKSEKYLPDNLFLAMQG